MLTDLPVEQQEWFWRGMYEQCRVLLTSPRMHKPQVEIIENQAHIAMDELRKFGVRFKGDPTDDAESGSFQT